MTRFARPSGRRRKRLRCLTSFDSNLQQVLILHVESSAQKRKKRPKALFSELVGRAGFEPATN